METSVVRVRRSVTEKRRIVELTLQAGASVARVAQAEGVNSHQVFQWRRAYRLGELVEAGEGTSSLLPVVMAAVDSKGRVERGRAVGPELGLPSGAIHIELPGRASIRVERGAERALVQAILESLRR
ncbi:MAG: transposase [Terriglobales bacterium]